MRSAERNRKRLSGAQDQFRFLDVDIAFFRAAKAEATFPEMHLRP
jgi:hypothetical protein